MIILVKPEDDITGPDYTFLGNRGLLLDSYEESSSGDPAFVRPCEWVSHWSDLGVWAPAGAQGVYAADHPGLGRR